MLAAILLVGLGIAIGAFATLWLDRFLMRIWLRSQLNALGNTADQAGRYYNKEKITPCRLEAAAFSAIEKILQGLKHPTYFWRFVEDALQFAQIDLQTVFNHKQVLHELQKCDDQIEALSIHFSKSDHLLCSAKHFMAGLADFRSKSEYDHYGYTIAIETLPNIQRLIGEMKSLLQSVRSKT
jgi:hypothetical protein